MWSVQVFGQPILRSPWTTNSDPAAAVAGLFPSGIPSTNTVPLANGNVTNLTLWNAFFPYGLSVTQAITLGGIQGSANVGSILIRESTLGQIAPANGLTFDFQNGGLRFTGPPAATHSLLRIQDSSAQGLFEIASDGTTSANGGGLTNLNALSITNAITLVITNNVILTTNGNTVYVNVLGGGTGTGSSNLTDNAFSVVINPGSTLVGNAAGITNFVLASGVLMTNPVITSGATFTNYSTTSAGELHAGYQFGINALTGRRYDITNGTYYGDGSGLTNTPAGNGIITLSMGLILDLDSGAAVMLLDL